MKQSSAKPTLLAVTALMLSCVECDGGVGAAHAKLDRPTGQVTAAGTVQRKRGAVSHRVRSRKANARSISKSSRRRQLAIKQGQSVRLMKSQQAVRLKKPERPALNAGPAKRQIAMLGLASFYSEDRETASGERFDRHGLNAAHPSLPFGTRLRVTNVRNGRSVVVRVNDRGPFAHGRIIDVTAAAAEALGMVNIGVAKVTLDIVR